MLYSAQLFVPAFSIPVVGPAFSGPPISGPPFSAHPKTSLCSQLWVAVDHWTQARLLGLPLILEV